MKRYGVLFLIPVLLAVYLGSKMFFTLSDSLQVMLLGALGMSIIFGVGSFFQNRR